MLRKIAQQIGRSFGEITGRYRSSLRSRTKVLRESLGELSHTQRNSADLVRQSVPEISRREPDTMGRSLAPPLEPHRNVDSYGMPETRRKYTKGEYIEMWERKIGRKMTALEKSVLDQGCVGITKLHLGRYEELPPMNLAFGDPKSHDTIMKAEKILAPGEIANADVQFWRRQLARAEELMRTRGTAWSATDGSGVTREALEHIDHCKRTLEQARSEAKEAWSNLAKEYKREAIETRNAARLEGNQRTFERVRGYVSKFNEILAAKPADAGEFMRLVKADPDLTRLRDVEQHLPPGDPSEWKAMIYSKHFWSGQDDTTKSDTSHPRGYLEGTPDPDATRFSPDPATGQVDMSGDLNQAKPGYVNFDYACYDDETGSWWHANHGEYNDPNDPMMIYQSTSDRFFSGHSDFDSSVICIGFTKDSPRPDG